MVESDKLMLNQEAQFLSHLKNIVDISRENQNNVVIVGGIAMSNGSDIAIESAEITILKGDIVKVKKAWGLSKNTLKTIKENLFWAFIYNLIGIPIAAGLLYPIFGIQLNPIFAGMAMSLSSVSVVSNSLKLRWKKLE